MYSTGVSSTEEDIFLDIFLAIFIYYVFKDDPVCLNVRPWVQKQVIHSDLIVLL